MDDYPEMKCPKCGHEEPDLDGFGMLYCEKCGYCNECPAHADAKRPLDRLVTRPGPGWTHLAGGVWEHSSKARIHVGGGMIRLPNKTHLTISHWTDGELGRQLIKINGGNRKRGLMAWAVNLVGV